MTEQDLKTYEDETTITYISFPIYQAHKIDSILFCVYSGAPQICIGNKKLERTVRHSGGKSIPIMDSKRDLKFGDTRVSSRGMF